MGIFRPWRSKEDLEIRKSFLECFLWNFARDEMGEGDEVEGGNTVVPAMGMARPHVKG